jgi:hypothetical protein
MKSAAISVLMLSMTLFFVSCENEGQPTQNTSDVETQSMSKKGGKLKPELIIFKEGNLEGNQTVFGCCPNAGPFPEYTMTLSGVFGNISGTYDGHIFMNSTGRQSPGDYIVQFWWGNKPNNYFIEIRGGEAHNDRRNKILTVIFEDAQCEIYINDVLTETVYVSFILTRAKL